MQDLVGGSAITSGSITNGPVTDTTRLSQTPVLQVEGLTVQVATPLGGKTVLDNLSFSLVPNEVLCLAGESGSGKSMTALAIMGLLPRPSARITQGRILLNGVDLAQCSEREYRRYRATKVAMIFQEPMTSLNPLMTIGEQLTEVIVAHKQAAAGKARAVALQLLTDVRMTSAEQRLKQYPHELSGGMRQRVMIAMALACKPDVLIADEPTTALDVTVQAEILDLIKTLQARSGTAVIMITHDMGVVAQVADRVIVMRHGQALETAPVAELFNAPSADYTRELLDAVPRLGAVDLPRAPVSRVPAPPTVVEVDELQVRFPVTGGLFNRVVRNVHAVENVSFSIGEAETLALVGESGSGKSTIGKALLALVPFSGAIRVNGRSTKGLSRASMRGLRKHVQMIFQDPYASLDPRMTVGDQVAEPMVVHKHFKGAALQKRTDWLFDRVGLASDAGKRHPHELSGGQRQRVCIARALALNPRLIVADECVSALDVSVQAKVLQLLKELRDEEGISFLFISHDMAVVEQFSDRVAVLLAGQIVEIGNTRQVLHDARHHYTQRLLSAVPVPDPSYKSTPVLGSDDLVANVLRVVGDNPQPVNLKDIGGGHWVAG